MSDNIDKDDHGNHEGDRDDHHHDHESGFLDHSETNDTAFDLPRLETSDFRSWFQNILFNDNQGAGIDVSGASGSGKSNFMEWAAIESLKAGIPILVIDPHGDSARRISQNMQALSNRIKKKTLYLELSSIDSLASINPLAKPADIDRLSPYQQNCHRSIQIELVASIILAAVGEAGAGFGFRPVLKKWTVRWLTILYDSGLTLPCASMLLDPNHPVYQQLLKLVSDDMARFQMSALSDMRPNDQESEIGSARNRFLSLLNHPATIAFMSRNANNIDMDQIYAGDISLIVNAEKGGTLTDEFQKMAVNIILVTYLQVVFKTPEHRRRRRLCMIDELPIFVESCAPMLERCCTEIRKYKTSFLFCHQGANRFPDRTENPFLLTMLDMCRTKVWFRHGIDRKFFGEQLASATGSKPVIKHRQVNEQQFQDGYTVLNLVDQNVSESEASGESIMSANTVTSDSGNSITSTLRQAADRAKETSSTQSRSSGSSKQTSNTSQKTVTKSQSTTYKQTAVANVITKLVSTGVQYYSPEEFDRGAVDFMYKLGTGEAAVFTEGANPPFKVQTPLAKNEYQHAPKFGAKKLRKYLDTIASLPEFEKPEQILLEHEGFIERLLEELYLLPVATPSTSPVKRIVQGELLLGESTTPFISFSFATASLNS